MKQVTSMISTLTFFENSGSSPPARHDGTTDWNLILPSKISILRFPDSLIPACHTDISLSSEQTQPSQRDRSCGNSSQYQLFDCSTSRFQAATPVHPQQRKTYGSETNGDPKIGDIVYFGKDQCTIIIDINCKNQRLFALEANRPVPSYSGRCPLCGKEHVKFAYQRGYYAAVSTVRDAIAKQNLERQRIEGRSTTQNLLSVTDFLPPLTQPVLGKNKGIEGDSNSCYMDATIFCMFAYNNVFDSLLHMKVDQRVADLQTRLRDNVVNVLRTQEGFVRRMYPTLTHTLRHVSSHDLWRN